MKQESKTRYYVHGDCSEAELDTYFCASCDLFVSREHFDTKTHSTSDGDRFRRSLKAWREAEKTSLKNFQRPQNAENIFKHLQRPPKQRTSRFYRWLKKQKERDDPISDLAMDVARDSSFPSSSDSNKRIELHLVAKKACPEAILALEEAWREFQEHTPRRSGISLRLRMDIFKRDGFQCQICGIPKFDSGVPNPRVRLEVDHKVAVVKGGSDDPDNLWTLCFECNRGKRDRDL